MTTIRIPTNQINTPFFTDIIEDGYHVFSIKNAQIDGYYPSRFDDYPGVNLKELKIGDVVTIRVFFRIGSGEDVRADGGYIDLEIEHIEDDAVLGVVLTKLPKGFPLQAGGSLEIFEDEILYRTKSTEH